jgi:hypothetical protein
MVIWFRIIYSAITHLETYRFKYVNFSCPKGKTGTQLSNRNR